MFLPYFYHETLFFKTGFSLFVPAMLFNKTIT
jgi:hypothetical protein